MQDTIMLEKHSKLSESNNTLSLNKIHYHFVSITQKYTANSNCSLNGNYNTNQDYHDIPLNVYHAFRESDKYFPTQIQKFQFYDKYARFNYDLGRRETWIETVDRAIAYLRELSDDRLSDEIYQRIRQGILEMRAMPSMRLLAMAGPAARRNNVTIYNCSYLPADSIDAFVEALIISMCGCGVGFSVERQYVAQLPQIQYQHEAHVSRHVVADSAEGWAEALRLGLETWFSGYDITFDYSLVRPVGTPLKIKGGRASGPAPLHKMLDFAREKILAKQGGYLSSLDTHDIMCSIGGAAVSGGVRRTAMISLFDFDDDDMLRCKDGDFWKTNSQRWNANNSAVWPEHELTQTDVTNFMRDMVEGNRGEPGIFNRRAANNTKPKRRASANFGTNPCVTADTWVHTTEGPRQVADLIGKQHWFFVHGQPFATTEKGFWYTGTKPIVKLKTQEGYELQLTENHLLEVVTYHTRKVERTQWKEVGQLKPGDLVKLHTHRTRLTWDSHGTFDEGWLLGSLVGDGTFSTTTNKKGQILTKAHLDYWGEHNVKMANDAFEMIHSTVGARIGNSCTYYAPANKYRISSTNLANLAEQYHIVAGEKDIGAPVETASSDFYVGFLQGLFDADGSVIGTQNKGVSVRLAQSDLPALQAVQRMLLRLGIASTIYLNRRPEKTRLLPDGKGGLKKYLCKAQHELAISCDNVHQFATRIGFSEPAKADRLSEVIRAYRRKPNRETFRSRVKSIEPDGIAPVYDCSVPGPNVFDANGFVTHNCGEISLRPRQFCNLTIAVARPHDTYETLKAKVELATIIGTIQSTATYFPGLRPEWHANGEEERLLGVDITGQMDSTIVQNPKIMEQLRQVAIETNQKIAKILEVEPAVAVTCVKPSGNSSVLLNCSAGIHARWSKYYVRNVRVATHSPIFKVLKAADVPMDPENGQTAETADTWVVHFPIKSPEHAITRHDRSAIEQLNYWLQNKIHWTEHNPSCTISFRPDEVQDIIRWVWEHQDKIGGLTFLPIFDAQYEQMPYEEISAEAYEALAVKFPDIDFSKLYHYEKGDFTTAAQLVACFAGQCDV
ncbi:MAG: hypothetical protein B6242_08975 [Anaerolineaceae bacterium 4572_78]|nr:MAG: hypothetical protein B6242_08975 [Anaerolineaceae bacterium 4572_78]